MRSKGFFRFSKFTSDLILNRSLSGNAGAIPFVQRLWADGKLSEPLFAFAFARSTSPQDSTVLTPGGMYEVPPCDIATAS